MFGVDTHDSCGDFANDPDDGVEFDSTAGFCVLQHRRLEGSELRRDDVAIFRRLLDGATDAPSDLGSFAHDGGTEVTH
jgi:hypothetical protein